MATKSRAYSAEDIEILEDLSPILHRPGMYTDPVNPNHALVEVIDNASDDGATLRQHEIDLFHNLAVSQIDGRTCDFMSAARPIAPDGDVPGFRRGEPIAFGRE